MDEYRWSQKEYLDCLNREPVGVENAKKVARILRSGKSLYKQHRDYCGHGLTYRAGNYCLIVVYDGWLANSEVLTSFESEESFVLFLSRQSDFTLSGASIEEPLFYTDDKFLLNNQRLTLKILQGDAFWVPNESSQ